MPLKTSVNLYNITPKSSLLRFLYSDWWLFFEAVLMVSRDRFSDILPANLKRGNLPNYSLLMSSAKCKKDDAELIADLRLDFYSAPMAKFFKLSINNAIGIHPVTRLRNRFFMSTRYLNSDATKPTILSSKMNSTEKMWIGRD